MDIARRLFAIGIAAHWITFAQVPGPEQIQPDGSIPPQTSRAERDRLPNGKSRSNAIAEDEHKHAMEEADQLVKLAQDLQKQLHDAGKYVVPMQAVKDTHEIEKLARKIRGRLQE
ncbi:MAG TPA: hypothetical protein VN633_06995 [Bryobacteraceae bacterium]|nr:hypothetical protein [Bryobacteraceae bacterium]